MEDQTYTMSNEHEDDIIEIVDIMVTVKHWNDHKVDVTGVNCQSKMERRLTSYILKRSKRVAKFHSYKLLSFLKALKSIIKSKKLYPS